MSTPENIRRRIARCEAEDAYAPERDTPSQHVPPQQRRGLPDYPVRVLSYSDLRGIGVAYSRVHLNRLIEAGEFPPPIRLSASRIGWLEGEVIAWIRARADARLVPQPQRRKRRPMI